MTTNVFQRLRELLPLPPVLVGTVLLHHDDDTSTVEIPSNAPLTGYAGNVATGRLIRPRGTTVPVGKKAFVRAGVIETQAPDDDAIDVPIGTVVLPTPPAPPPLPDSPFWNTVSAIGVWTFTDGDRTGETDVDGGRITSAQGHFAGERYVEVLVVKPFLNCRPKVGLVASASPPEGAEISNAIVFERPTVAVSEIAKYVSGVRTVVAAAPTLLSGDVIGLLANFSTGVFSIYRNGSLLGSASLSAGTYYVLTTHQGAEGLGQATSTLRTEAGSFTHSPSGTALPWAA
jgi:hypothetical protein